MEKRFERIENEGSLALSQAARQRVCTFNSTFYVSFKSQTQPVHTEFKAKLCPLRLINSDFLID